MKTVLFCVNYRRMQGAHLKIFHYFQHVRASGIYTPKVYFHPETVWDSENPWVGERDYALPAYEPEKADVILMGGMFNWLMLPAELREDYPAPILCPIQGFSHTRRDNPRYPMLRYRAARVCVSQPVAASVRETGMARGPVFVVPNAIDLPAGPALPPHVREPGLLIAGQKAPRLAIKIETTLRESGWPVRTLTGQLPRADYLGALARAETVLLLPTPTGEGFFLPALEAMALGTLVICPDAGGNREFCVDGVNCLLPPYERAAILAACQASRELAPSQRAGLLLHAQATARSHSLEAEREAFLRILHRLPELWAKGD